MMNNINFYPLKGCGYFKKIFNYKKIHIHSVFKNSINFLAGKNIFSFINSDFVYINSLSFKNIDFLKFKNTQNLYLYSDKLYLDNHCFHLNTDFFKFTYKIKKKNPNKQLNKFCNRLIENINLTDADNFRKKSILLFNQILEKNQFSHIDKIIGLGTGLTPDGDDLILGLLNALLFINTEKSLNLFSLVAKKIKLNQHKTNIISYNFLKNTAEKKIYELIYLFIYHLFNSDFKKITLFYKELIKIGHNSGSSISYGILKTINKFAGENK